MTRKAHSRGRTRCSDALSRGLKARKWPENQDFPLRPSYANSRFSEPGLSSPGKIYCSNAVAWAGVVRANPRIIGDTDDLLFTLVLPLIVY